MNSSSTVSGPAVPATAEGHVALAEDFRVRHEAELADWIARRRARLAAVAPEAVELVDAVADLAGAGGKRLRPALVTFGYRAAGGREPATVAPIALAVELLHTYLLIHDDIMDHAALRRSRPAAHVRLARRFAELGLAGDGDDRGRSLAILAGDLAHAWAVELFAEGRRLAPAAVAAELDRTWAAMCEEVVAGQTLELVVAARGSAREDELLRVLRLKSGLYSVERPLQLGAVAAEAPPPVAAALAAYGRALGEAFQLQDDVLGLFGDEDAVGKPVGGDLAEGKFTFLVFHALALLAQEPAAARLSAALGRADLPAAEASAAVETVRASGALGRVEAMIADRLVAARAALAGVDLEPTGAAYLEGLLDVLARRRR